MACRTPFDYLPALSCKHSKSTFNSHSPYKFLILYIALLGRAAFMHGIDVLSFNPRMRGTRGFTIEDLQ